MSFDAELEGISYDAKGGAHLGATGELAIDRREWGLVWNQPLANGVLVGDTVKIDLGLAAVDEATAHAMGLLEKTAA